MKSGGYSSYAYVRSTVLFVVDSWVQVNRTCNPLIHRWYPFKTAQTTCWVLDGDKDINWWSSLEMEKTDTFLEKVQHSTLNHTNQSHSQIFVPKWHEQWWGHGNESHTIRVASPTWMPPKTATQNFHMFRKSFIVYLFENGYSCTK